MALCENNCKFNSYESNTKQVICDCPIKNKQIVISEMINQTDLFYYNFTKEEESTMNTIKCYYTLFSKEGIISNIANYILLFTIILFMISSILFYKCGYSLLEMIIEEKLSLRINKIKNNIKNKKSKEKNIKEKINKTVEILKKKKKKKK